MSQPVIESAKNEYKSRCWNTFVHLNCLFSASLHSFCATQSSKSWMFPLFIHHFYVWSISLVFIIIYPLLLLSSAHSFQEFFTQYVDAFYLIIYFFWIALITDFLKLFHLSTYPLDTWI